jgi:hypothetical protein
MTRTLLLALLVLVPPGLPAAAQSYGEVNAALVDEVVVPAYQRYAAAIARLPASLDTLCANPDQERLEAAQEVWREAMLAWQHAQPIAFGPLADLGLAPQIEFWPDKHGTAGRQFSQAMTSRDASLLDPEQLSGKSVGLTSLVSLERLLFGDTVLDAEGGDYACAYAVAIARHQVHLAETLVEAWSGEGGFRTVVTGAGPGNEVFFSPYDPAAALYRSLADSLDGAIQVKLEPPMGDSLEAARGRLGENWRSGMELPRSPPISRPRAISTPRKAASAICSWRSAAMRRSTSRSARVSRRRCRRRRASRCRWPWRSRMSQRANRCSCWWTRSSSFAS